MSDTVFKYLPPTGLSLLQGPTALDVFNLTPNLKGYNIFTITVTNSGTVNITLDDVINAKFSNQALEYDFNNKTMTLNVEGAAPTYTLSCVPPDPAIHTLIAQVDPETPPPLPDHVRWEACYRCATVVVAIDGSVISYDYDSTTNNINLAQILIDQNLIPTQGGEYLYIFVFYGWRKFPDSTPGNWISADDKYDIWTDNITASLLA
jgi:hypothetical protein